MGDLAKYDLEAMLHVEFKTDFFVQEVVVIVVIEKAFFLFFK